MANSPAELLELCGGITAVAKHFNLAVSTVGSWKARNSIPDRFRPGMIEFARSANVEGIDYRWMTLVHADEGAQLAAQQ